MKLCSLSLLQESFQFFRRVANLQAEPECHSQKLFSLPLPPCMGVSHQVTQAVLQFRVFCLNLRINIAKGKHISFYSASRGKARSRKGTEMKDITTGGTRPPADEQTIPRIARKYFQPCGRAGQGGLPCSHTQCAVTLSVMGILKKHQIQLAEGSKLSMVSSSPDCLHCVYWGSSRQGAAGFLWQLSSCVHSGTELSPSGTDSLQHTDLQGSGFQGPVVVAMSSLLTPCQQKPLCAGNCSLVTVQPASLVLHSIGETGERMRHWCHHLSHCPQRAALLRGCRCPLWGVGITLRLGRLSGIICLQNVHGKFKCWASLPNCLQRLFYLRIALPLPKVCLFKQENQH